MKYECALAILQMQVAPTKRCSVLVVPIHVDSWCICWEFQISNIHLLNVCRWIYTYEISDSLYMQFNFYQKKKISMNVVLQDICFCKDKLTSNAVITNFNTLNPIALYRVGGRRVNGVLYISKHTQITSIATYHWIATTEVTLKMNTFGA